MKYREMDYLRNIMTNGKHYKLLQVKQQGNVQDKKEGAEEEFLVEKTQKMIQIMGCEYCMVNLNN